MYDPYDENRNDESGQKPVEPIYEQAAAPDTPIQNAETPAPDTEDADSAYHYVRPDADRAPYSEANYSPASDARPAVPRYYYTEQDASRKKEKKKEKASGFSFGKILAVCLVCALLGGLCGGAIGALYGAKSSQEPSAAAQTDIPSLNIASGDSSVPDPQATDGTGADQTVSAVDVTGENLTAQEIYDLACTQVVGVKTEITYTNIFGSTSSGAVSGSGFIITEDGYIMTNYHVIEDAVKGGYEISVMLYNGDTYTASVVGYEADNDIAVLKIDASGLNPVVFGDSDEMSVGDSVYAVGNPLGELDYTMTSGMVSALDRAITTTDSSTGASTTINMFQFDAAVNSGNSGGTVYNEKGQIIGVVTAKYSDSGVEGLGFAIPSNDATYIANELIANGYVSGKAYFGITVGTVSNSVAQYYNWVEGAYVKAVDSTSCAATAGLEVGDIITMIDDTEIASQADLVTAKKNYRAGDTAVLTVYRNGETIELSITFDEELPTTTTATTGNGNSGSGQQGDATNPFGGSSGFNPFG